MLLHFIPSFPVSQGTPEICSWDNKSTHSIPTHNEQSMTAGQWKKMHRIKEDLKKNYKNEIKLVLLQSREKKNPCSNSHGTSSVFAPGTGGHQPAHLWPKRQRQSRGPAEPPVTGSHRALLPEEGYRPPKLSDTLTRPRAGAPTAAGQAPHGGRPRPAAAPELEQHRCRHSGATDDGTSALAARAQETATPPARPSIPSSPGS